MPGRAERLSALHQADAAARGMANRLESWPTISTRGVGGLPIAHAGYRGSLDHTCRVPRHCRRRQCARAAAYSGLGRVFLREDRALAADDDLRTHSRPAAFWVRRTAVAGGWQSPGLSR